MFPNNKVDLGLFFGGSSVVLFAREEAKKLGMVEEDLLSEPRGYQENRMLGQLHHLLSSLILKRAPRDRNKSSSS